MAGTARLPTLPTRVVMNNLRLVDVCTPLRSLPTETHDDLIQRAIAREPVEPRAKESRTPQAVVVIGTCVAVLCFCAVLSVMVSGLDGSKSIGN